MDGVTEWSKLWCGCYVCTGCASRWYDSNKCNFKDDPEFGFDGITDGTGTTEFGEYLSETCIGWRGSYNIFLCPLSNYQGNKNY